MSRRPAIRMEFRASASLEPHEVRALWDLRARVVRLKPGADADYQDFAERIADSGRIAIARDPSGIPRACSAGAASGSALAAGRSTC